MNKTHFVLDTRHLGQFEFDVPDVPLSEAMLEGQKEVEFQCHDGTYVDFINGACHACAMGAALIHFFGKDFFQKLYDDNQLWMFDSYAALIALRGETLSLQVINPAIWQSPKPLDEVIWDLNDQRYWSITKIAEQVQAFETGQIGGPSNG